MDATKGPAIETARAPFAPTRFAATDVAMHWEPDGTVRLFSNIPLGHYDRQVGVWRRRWAEATPERVFLAERNAAGQWRQVSYHAARAATDRLSQALLDRGLDRRRPIAILPEKSVDHALLGLAAMRVGIPAVRQEVS